MTNEANKTDQRPVDMYPVLPLCWANLDDTDLADAIEELDDWVSWLIDRYALDCRTIPPCWDKHGALIEELSALRTAGFAAFSGTSRPRGPVAAVSPCFLFLYRPTARSSWALVILERP
jgi:hypothetical protein